MNKLVIKGLKKLRGEQTVQGSKNACLPIIVATILTKGENILHRCPLLIDTVSICEILKLLGCKTKRQSGTLIINSEDMDRYEISKYLMNKTRSSIIFLGALLSRFKKATVSFPGGCSIGSRPIDLHIDALKKMGVKIKETDEQLICSVEKENLVGAQITLSFPSVGATENIILAATTAKGKTTIKNAAVEPEIEDLCRYLTKCGAKISGIGTQLLEIEGVKTLTPCEHTIMPDRIVAATLLCGAAATGGEVLLKSINSKYLNSVLPVLEIMGCNLKSYKNNIYLNAKNKLSSTSQIRTMPHPGFPTDMQPIMMALACVASGTTIFVETIFENRFKHVPELKKFGASIKIEDRIAIVNEVKKLRGTEVCATDLRGGAALIVAALAASGKTEISNVHYIDRGYEKIEKQFKKLGANIIRK